VNARLVLAVVGSVLAATAALAQTAPASLDAFMSRVLERRDDNWKKLQQYVLEERETFQVTGPSGPLYGFRRDYAWFPRDGRFVKSPLRADGVTIGDAERRRAEADWLKREEERERRQANRQRRAAEAAAGTNGDVGKDGTAPLTEASVREALEPGFVSAAYFLRFTFDPGQYALVGRETRNGRQLLRVEYYPTRLFSEGRTRPNRQLREQDDKVGARMNKASLVTLWIDSDEYQIVEYELENIDMDFLPGRSIVRVDGITAAMRMTQPFPGVWLPASIGMQFGMTMAVGSVDARYDVAYHDYRLATTGGRVIP
jgi:hypothetical protein